MGYFDSGTVTAIWNYAQYFALSDNFFGSTFGSSTPGHINLISGQTHGASPLNLKESGINFVVNGTLISDANPILEGCSNVFTKSFPKVSLNGTNIGDLLNQANVTLGWFQGGFIPTNITADGKPVCLHMEYTKVCRYLTISHIMNHSNTTIQLQIPITCRQVR